MNKKMWNVLTFAAAVMVCYLFWMLFLGDCNNDGFLDLDMVEMGDIGVKYDFVTLCLFPPIMMGYVVVSLIEELNKKRRMKNGNQGQS